MRLSRKKMQNNNLLKMRMGEEDFMEHLQAGFLLDFITQLVRWKDGLQAHLNRLEAQNLHHEYKTLMILWTMKYIHSIYL